MLSIPLPNFSSTNLTLGPEVTTDLTSQYCYLFPAMNTYHLAAFSTSNLYFSFSLVNIAFTLSEGVLPLRVGCAT
jgi:hypothetical protein